MMMAKNCALDVLRRRRPAANAVLEVSTLLQSECRLEPELDELLYRKQKSLLR
jgi:hypothetical protein